MHEQQHDNIPPEIDGKTAASSQQLLHALVEHGPEAVMLLDDHGQILYANPAMTALIGYDAEELTGRSIFSLIHPDDVEEIRSLHDKLISITLVMHAIEHRMQHKNGSWRWLEANASNLLKQPDIAAIVYTYRDGSRHRDLTSQQNKTFLKDMQELIAGIVETVRQALIVLDGEMKVIKANEYFYEFFQAHPREIEGVSIYELGHGLWNIPRLKELLERILPSNNPFDGFEVENDFPGMGHRVMVLNARQLKLNGTGQERILLACEDITERREAERRKDDFIVMASHELKTPVTSLKGFTQILQNRLKKRGDEQDLHFLERMDGQLNKLTRLIKDLLDLSRMPSGELPLQENLVDLNELVQNTVADMREVATHRFLIEETERISIYGDRERLEQVFLNLLVNAVKYSPGADKIVIRITRSGEEAHISVQDFGIGIAEADQHKVFERFYQVSDTKAKPFSGMGIGLYLSNEIVKRHRGRIEINSQPGQGATFLVALPLLKDEEQRKVC
ncbi:MAG TPA: PAS domain S-box protein [Ktedonobacteraceae bacterium]